MNVILSQFISIMLKIDNIIYTCIGLVYNLLLEIATHQIFSQDTINEFSSRVYALIGIFMLFKLTFSLITYVVNPDDMADKTKGLASIGKNVIIALVLIVLTPYIFAEATKLQNIVLQEHTLENIVFGTQTKSTDLDKGGNMLQFHLFSQFVKPNYEDIEELAPCKNHIYELDDSGNYAHTIVNDTGEESNNFKLNSECFDILDEKFEAAKMPGMFDSFKTGLSMQNYRLLTIYPSLYTATTEVTDASGNNSVEVPLIDYQFIISTIVGIVVLLVLIIFCIDIAVRTIKLAFFQIIAPIPIITYCDPKSAKSGMFNKWVKACFSTYLSLFIRLLALYLAVYIIAKVVDDASFSGIATIFIIIGALIFAKELPKIITDLTGIKLDGKFTLNPFKKIENEAVGGKSIAKVGQLGGRAIKGVGMAGLVTGASLATGQGFRGGGKAFAGSMKGEKFGKNFSAAYATARAGKKQDDEMKARGVSKSDVFAAKAYNAFHGETRAEQVKRVSEGAKKIQDSYETIKNQAYACDSNDGGYARNSDGTFKLDANGNRIITGSYKYDEHGNKVITKSAKTLSKELDEMKKTQIDRTAFTDVQGKTAEQQYRDAVEAKNLEIEKLSAKKMEYIDKQSDYNLQIARLKSEQSSYVPSQFASVEEYNKANAVYQERIKALEEMSKQYDSSEFEEQINRLQNEVRNMDESQFTDVQGKTAEQQYQEAIDEQRRAIKAKESEIEARINDIVNHRVRYTDEHGIEHSGLTIESANKIISEAYSDILSDVRDVNKLGATLDSNFVKMNEPTEADIRSGNVDVVQMSKEVKGIAAQAKSGEMEKITKISNYAQKNKK